MSDSGLTAKWKDLFRKKPPLNKAKTAPPSKYRCYPGKHSVSDPDSADCSNSPEVRVNDDPAILDDDMDEMLDEIDDEIGHQYNSEPEFSVRFGFKSIIM